MSNYLNQNNMAASSQANFEYADGIPLMKLKSVEETISVYKKLLAITVLANTITAIIGVVYL